MANIQDIIAENERRKEKLFANNYDPKLGIGSPIDRFPFYFFRSQKRSAVYLPITMKKDPLIEPILKGKFKTAEDYAESIGVDPDKYAIDIQERRNDYDFEFWAYTAIKIKNKDGGDDIPFKLNNGQRKLLKVFMDCVDRKKPIRVIMCKSRQWGGSTLTQIFMLWVQARHKTNWNSLIAAHLKQAATNIRSMLRKAIASFPYPMEKLTLVPFEGTQNIKIIPERQNKITVGSMETPDSIRSDDIAMAHLSEVGLWKTTDGKKPKDLIQSILGSIQMKPWTMVVIESTAKGVGNFFHTQYLEAKKNMQDGRPTYIPVFVAWHETTKDYMEFYDDKEREDLINSR